MRFGWSGAAIAGGAIFTACAGAGPITPTPSRPAEDAGVEPSDAQAEAPPPEPHVAALAPGARVAKGSLFQTDVIGLPTGATMTPDAAPGSRLFELDPHVASAPKFRAGGAISTAISPDGRTLLVLTSGYNRQYDDEGRRVPELSGELVVVYDIAGGVPREVQVVSVPNTFFGLTFNAAGDRFYVSGGPDDSVHELRNVGGRWSESVAAVDLGHRDAKGFGGLGLDASPYAAGVALTSDGTTVVVANHENDSLSLVDVASGSLRGEVPLRPGGGAAGGEYPLDVAIVGPHAFVTSERDRELVEVDVAARKVTRRIHVGGTPVRVIANREGTRLYVANSNSDTVTIIDRAAGVPLGDIATTAPPSLSAAMRALRGSNPNALALSPDGRTLYVSNGGTNTVAFIALSPRDRGEGEEGESRVVGLVPTGFYPNAVSVSHDGTRLYVAYGKSPTGPNPLGPWDDAQRATKHPYSTGANNQFALQLTRGGLHAFPVPDEATLARLTAQALLDNRFADEATEVPEIFRQLAGKVKHVIYIVGENRTYDQLLGDVATADGDPKLVHWGRTITPNHHALASTFVTLDRYFCSGGVSGDGWQWTSAGRSTDVAEKEVPLEYAGRGYHSYDWEGTNRNINIGLATLAERLAANPYTPTSIDLLPGNADVAAIDGPAEGGRGFLWDVALAAGLSVRNYGAFVDEYRYGLPKKDKKRIDPIHMPFATHTRVSYPTRASLGRVTDPYFRAFDTTFADFWRYEEWEREFDAYVKKNDFPALEIVRFVRDHLGSFDSSEDGVDTPDSQMADNDYALGLLVEKVSKSPYWESTVIVKVEDDAQNGADHVDAHRSFAIFAGGHIKRGGVAVSSVYATPSVLRTIELLLGLPPLGQRDALAPPMSDVLAVDADVTPYVAITPPVLRSTKLPVPNPPGAESSLPRGDRATWAAATRGFDFKHVDAVPTVEFNRLLYCGLVDTTGCTSSATQMAAKGDDDE